MLLNEWRRLSVMAKNVVWREQSKTYQQQQPMPLLSEPFAVLPSSVFQAKTMFVQGFHSLNSNEVIISRHQSLLKIQVKYLIRIHLIFVLVYRVSGLEYDSFATRLWWEIQNTNIWFSWKATKSAVEDLVCAPVKGWGGGRACLLRLALAFL